MKRMMLFFIVAMAACNYDAGDCYMRSEESQGAGGGVILPIGTGGFGSVPLEPQNTSGDWDPCSAQTAECTVTWKAGSNVCKSQGTESSCTTLYQGPHETLDEALKRCEFIYGIGKGSDAQSCGPCQWVQAISKACTSMYVSCHDKGYLCTRQVEWGKTLCAVCRDDCQANRPYRYNDCFTCGFQ